MNTTRSMIAACGALILSASMVFAQSPEKPKRTFSASISKKDTTIKADVLSDKSDFLPSENLTYYWFSANKILETKGGYDGRLLHGSYTSFYGNKQLRQKGKFRWGIKRGKWTSWYSDGKINEVSHWSNGKKNGRFTLYNQEGKVMLVANFSNDKLNGKMISYENGKILSVTKYRNGNVILPKVRNKETKQVSTKEPKSSSKPSFKERLKRWFGPKERKPEENPKVKEKKSKQVSQS